MAIRAVPVFHAAAAYEGLDLLQHELLRHSTIQRTMNVYTQTILVQKHTANSKVVDMILSNSPGSSPAA